MKPKIINSLRSLLALVLFTPLTVVSAYAEEPLPKKVGLILPLTGDVASFGEDIRKVAIFANKKLGSNQFQLIFEDDGCLGKNAVTATRKLLDVTRINFGMVGCTGPMLSTAPLFESSKTLVITPLASGASVSASGDYIFRTWPNDALAGKLLFDYVKTRHKRFGLLSENRGYPQELAKSFTDAAAGSKLDLLVENYTLGQDTFKPLLLKLKGENVDGLLVNPDGSRSLQLIVKSLKELHWNVPLYGVYMPGNKDFLGVAGTSADGIIFVDGPSIETFTREGRMLFEEFEKKFGVIQSSPFIFASTYEAVRLITYLSKEQGDFREFLYNRKFEGVFGSYSFDFNGDIQGPVHVLKIIRNGKVQLLD